MIKINSKISIIDNSGVNLIKCINILKKKEAHIGDIIFGIIKKISLKKINFKISNIIKAILIREKNFFRYLDGKTFNFKDNSAVLIDNKNNIIGNRIFGFVPNFFKEKKFLKLSSLIVNFI